MSRLAALALASVLLLAACGKEREPAPRVFDVEPPRGWVTERLAEPGITLERPRNWRLRRREAPAAFELLSGEAVIAGWAYPREEELPATEAQLEAARERLVEAVKERDPEFELDSAVTTSVAGAPAIDIRGEQVVARRRLWTRSVHVFEGDVEYVVDALAPPRDSRLVDRRVLDRVLRSLELEGEVTEEAG